MACRWSAGSTPPAPPDHPRLLGALCRLAERLCLDLVVEARPHLPGGGYAWNIHFELPGSTVPAPPSRYSDDLLTAIAGTTAQDAVTDLAERSAHAPAHYLVPAPPPIDSVRLESTDIDQLERRILRDCEGTAGAHAIWRDGRWWHTSLGQETGGEQLVELETGQLLRQGIPAFWRGWEPPTPRYLGEPIPRSPCHGCAGSGAHRPHFPCGRCGGTGVIHHGVVLTVTDLRERTVHHNWRHDQTEAASADSNEISGYDGGARAFQLPEPYRVAHWATPFGVPLEELTDLIGITGESDLDHHLRHGVSTPADPSADPVRSYLYRTAAGRPGARLLVRADDQPGDHLTELARLAFGLGLGVEIRAVDHHRNTANPYLVQGVRWSVEVVDPAASRDGEGWRPEPYRCSLAGAAAVCLADLGVTAAEIPPADPDRPVPVPQQPAPVQLPADLAEPVRRLTAEHPGQAVAVRWTADCCRSWLPD